MFQLYKLRLRPKPNETSIAARTFRSVSEGQTELVEVDFASNNNAIPFCIAIRDAPKAPERCRYETKEKLVPLLTPVCSS